jgi:uncharacterized FlaG/YvyC family protein
MDVKIQVENQKIQVENQNIEGFALAEIKSENVKKVIGDLNSIKSNYVASVGSPIDVKQMQEIIESVNSKLQSLGIFLAFDKIGNLPVVKVVTHTGEVIKVFPPEEVGRILERVSLFFDILFDFLISQYA